MSKQELSGNLYQESKKEKITKIKNFEGRDKN